MNRQKKYRKIKLIVDLFLLLSAELIFAAAEDSNVISTTNDSKQLSFSTSTTLSANSTQNSSPQASLASTTTSKSSIVVNKDLIIEFDESDIRNLNLKINWRLNRPDSAIKPTKFVLLYEQKRLNLSTFLFDYSSPQLIDDESTIQTSTMKADNLITRVPLLYQSNIDCALSCINSTKYSNKNQTFDCNIYYYEPQSKYCVLYEYDFTNSSKKIKTADTPFEAFDYFIDECEMDEILGDVVGYSKYCRRILDFKESHVVKINPYIDYRFSISVRDENNLWSNYARREYQYAPKITIDVKGELKIGNNVSLECKTELGPSIIDSITWKNNAPANKNILNLTPLTVHNMYLTYFCEIRYNFVRMIQKAFKLNITNMGDLKPKLSINYKTDIENLNVKLHLNVTAPIGDKFLPEKLILLYSENNQTYKFVNKYLLFEISNYDNIKFSNQKQIEEIVANNEDECAMNCLQKSYCDHFVFIRSIEPFRNSKKKNCQLSTNTHENIMPCRYDSLCANLSPYDKHVQNDTLSIFLLPNITYRFKMQLKDKLLNWTDEIETDSITIPLQISIEEKGDRSIHEDSDESKFKLHCITNINKNIEHQISWLKDENELIIDNKQYARSWQQDLSYANSILDFKSLNKAKQFNYSGNYKCKIYIRYPDVGQGSYYVSEAKRVDFNFFAPLKYNITKTNITLPVIPGLLFELSCQVSGNPIPNLKWLIDGVNYNEKRFETLNDEPFIINITDKNNSLINNILVMKIDSARKLAKYQCILNDSIVIREHYLQVIDAKPRFEIKIDNSSLNKLKLTFKFRMTNKPDKRLSLNDYDTKPLKLFILYAENSTFNSAYQTVIAPETLSKTDIKSIDTMDRILFATLKSTQHGIQSCKILCFNTPFCKSYEYLMYEDSCNLFSNSKVETYYKNVVDKLKMQSSSSFNLIHLLQANILSYLQEDAYLNNSILIDKKTYPECEPKPTAFFLTEELHCSDELADYTDTYTIENLTPSTSYQFRIEIANAFGKSDSYLTEKIDIPFPLNPILEKDEIRNGKEFYSLECSTPLLETKKLEFKWYKNEKLISVNDTSFEQVLHQPMSQHNGASYSTELIFKDLANAKNSAYTCSLVYTDDHMVIAKNETFIYRTKTGPFFTPFLESFVNKSIGESWSDSCTAEGWPLPTIQWYFNNKPVANKTDTSNINELIPYMINHHRHLSVSSFIIVRNLSKYSTGRYSCVLNGKIFLKNTTLVSYQTDVNTKNNDNNFIDNKTKKDGKESIDSNSINDISNPNSKKSKSSSNKSIYIIYPFMILIVLATAGAAMFIFYNKRRRSNSNTSLSYNRIEEELISGVDNLTLTDDNQT